ncbi:hypothetical protein LRC39_08650 [Rhodopseudomonas sp. P1]|uniref:hypothetical protein n=1 Tax=Rhodopseudomonas sp. P1 TaxID=3434357 RepID=UPI0031FD3AFA
MTGSIAATSAALWCRRTQRASIDIAAVTEESVMVTVSAGNGAARERHRVVPDSAAAGYAAGRELIVNRS